MSSAVLDHPLPKPHPYTSEFAELLARVKSEGLLSRSRTYYITLIVILSLSLLATLTGMYFLGNTWAQLALAPAMAVIMTQFSFVTHEAAHRQVFSSGQANDTTARILANAVVGISYSWWMGKHTRHHANPNTIGKDPDIQSDFIMFQDDKAAETKGFTKAFVKRQGWLFFPILTLEGLNLHVQAFRRVFSKEPLKHRGTEITLLLARNLGYPVILLALMPWYIAAVFLVIHMALFGVYMGASFAPNHKGMPQIPAGLKVDFLRRQVMTSRNIRGGLFMDHFMGGLNYQVEHHLFPSMARPQLHKAARIVREFCAEKKIAYTETGLFQSYGIVIAYLNRVGLAARDPFDCPPAQVLGRA
ncbi:MAG: acyl-CoA desaturase [Microbacteriaceae bacterium]|jgi:fatty acid desaturase|nr:acyl-CoA desaturase [Microbacteriaceae bacterium]